MADTFSKTCAEAYALEQDAFACNGSLRETVRMTRKLIQESQDLIEKVDKVIGAVCVSGPSGVCKLDGANED